MLKLIMDSAGRTYQFVLSCIGLYVSGTHWISHPYPSNEHKPYCYGEEQYFVLVRSLTISYNTQASR